MSMNNAAQVRDWATGRALNGFASYDLQEAMKKLGRWESVLAVLDRDGIWRLPNERRRGTVDTCAVTA